MTHDDARTDGLADGYGLPALPTAETLRMAIVFLQRDIRTLNRHISENGRLDEDDRRHLARLDERTVAILSRLDAMSDPTYSAGTGGRNSDDDGWHDNAERTVGRVLDSSPGRILALVVLVTALGLFIVAGILAVKGDLDDVVRGALTPGSEVTDVRPGETLTPAPGS